MPAGATVAVAALHLWASSRIGHPSVVFDEAGYLGNARWLAGTGAGWEMPWSPRYAVGYPLLLAPLTRLFPDPVAQWRAILTLNAVLLASVLPLLYVVARRVLGAGRRSALLAAAVGAVVPAVVAAGVSAIAENLVLPLVPLTVLAGWSLGRSGPLWTRIGFAPCLVALYAAHPRFTVALPVGAMVLAWVAWRRVAPRAVVAVNAVLLVVGAVAVWSLSRMVVAARWSHVESLEGGPRDLWRLLTSRHGVAELAWTAAGQAWYLSVGSVGLVVIGMAVAARRARLAMRPAEVRAAFGASDRSTRSAAGEAAPLVGLVTLFGLALAVFAVSVAFFAQNQFRADHLVYGRHNDSFTPVWVTFALVGLAGASRRYTVAISGATVAVTVTLSGILMATREADAFGGRYSPFAVPGLIRSVAENPSGVYWRATLAAVAGVAAITVVAGVLRHPRALAVPLAVVAVWSGLGPVRGTEFYQGWWYASWTAPRELERLGITAVGIDGRSAGGFPALAYPFHLPQISFTTYEPALGEVPEEAFVLAPTTDERLGDLGARIVLVDSGGFYDAYGLDHGMALWVQPGPELDRLEGEGLLLPPGFPSGLPEPARQGTVEILDAPDRISVTSGEVVHLQVRGRHEGTGAPWPDHASYRGEARVRIVADVRPLDDGLPLGARSGGELPGWIRPGESFESEVVVAAVGRFFEPLPPGRYLVTLGVGQGEPEWFVPSPEAVFEMVVVP